MVEGVWAKARVWTPGDAIGKKPPPTSSSQDSASNALKLDVASLDMASMLGTMHQDSLAPGSLQPWLRRFISISPRRFVLYGSGRPRQKMLQNHTGIGEPQELFKKLSGQFTTCPVAGLLRLGLGVSKAACDIIDPGVLASWVSCHGPMQCRISSHQTPICAIQLLLLLALGSFTGKAHSRSCSTPS